MQQQDCILLVKNIPGSWDRNQLLEAFGPENSITDIKIFGKEHYGFITFTDTPTLNKWVEMKQYVVNDAFLDLSKGEKNSCLHIQIKNPSVSVDQINSVLDKKRISYFDLSKSRGEIIIKFHLRTSAEYSKRMLEDSFSDGISVNYADRENLPIAIHLFFRKDQASKDIGAFNKLELEKCFKAILNDEDDENGINLDVDIDLPYEGNEYKGYGTLVLTPSFKGISECERILRTQRGITVNGVYVRLSKHEHKKRQQSALSSTPFSSSLSSSPSPAPSSSSSWTSPSSSPSSLFTSPPRQSMQMINTECKRISPPRKPNSSSLSPSPSPISSSIQRNSFSISPSPSAGVSTYHSSSGEMSSSLSPSPFFADVSVPSSSSSTSPTYSKKLSALVSALHSMGSSKDTPFFVPKSRMNGKYGIGEREGEEKTVHQKDTSTATATSSSFSSSSASSSTTSLSLNSGFPLFFPEASVTFHGEMRMMYSMME